MKPHRTQTNPVTANILPNAPDVQTPPPFDWKELEALTDDRERAEVGDDLPTLEVPMLSEYTAALSETSGHIGNTEEIPMVFRLPENIEPAQFNQSRKLGTKFLALVMGAGVLAGAVFWPHGSHKGNVPQAATLSPAATAPAPTYDTLPPTSEATVPQTAPSTTIAKTSLAPAPTTTTKLPAVAETTAPQEQVLSADKIKALIDATGYMGLEKHTFTIAKDGEYDTAAAHIVIIRLDGASLPVPVSEIKADIAAAEAAAATHPSFTAKVQLGKNEPAQDVTFDIGPSKLSNYGQDTHYVVFAGPNQDMAALASPVTVYANQDTKEPLDAFTKNSPYLHINGSFIKFLANKLVDNLNANSFNTSVEAFQTSINASLSFDTAQRLHEKTPDTSYLANPNLPDANYQDLLANLGREIWVNSWAFARISARIGMSYDQYAKLAPSIPLRAYPMTDTYYFAVGPAQYAAMLSK